MNELKQNLTETLTEMHRREAVEIDLVRVLHRVGFRCGRSDDPLWIALIKMYVYFRRTWTSGTNLELAAYCAWALASIDFVTEAKAIQIVDELIKLDLSFMMSEFQAELPFKPNEKDFIYLICIYVSKRL